MSDTPDFASFRHNQIHPSVYLAEGVRIAGDVTIGEDSSVWFNAVIRGDCAEIRIGRRSNVQDNAVLHADPGIPCLIGDGVTIGHTAIVHGATIGDNVVIGMHSVVMNGAKVGANSIIGVGAVVTEGVEIPPGSLVMGLPGKIKRALSELEIEHNKFAAEHYVHNAQQYLAARRV
ncbi:MAG TPA: gamma carbonic anhydrase family protein [Pirellulales bacterium]|jgi:carbonic anhydrase/acetyltransferase-like protein (isoleucine patch superfamily)